jgi:phage terminase large subunit GpA-like protein
MSELQHLIHDSFKRQSEIDITNWCEANLRFDTAFDAASLYRISKTPWHNTVFNWLADSETRTITVISSTQTGKSTFLIGALLYCLQMNPGPALLCLSTEDTCRQFFKRFSATLEASFPGALPQDFSENLGGLIGQSYLTLAWSTSKARLKSRPCKYIFADETAEYRTSLSTLAARTKAFKNHKIIYSTSPELESEQTWQLANHGSQFYRMHFKCIFCNHYQPLEFKNLKFDHCKNDLGKWDYERVQTDTHYQCCNCNHGIPQRYQEEIISTGKAVCSTPERSAQRKALKLSALDSCMKSWGQIARAYLEMRATPEDQREFTTGWLGDPWKPTTKALRGKLVQERFEDHQYNTAPQNTKYLLAATDVQGKGETYTVVRAFLEDGRSVLISAVKLHDASMPALLDQLWHTVLNREYDIQGQTEKKIKITASTIDSGDGNNTALIYKFCLQHRNRVIPIKGADRVRQAFNLKASSVDKFPNTEIPIIPPLPLWHIKTSSYRDLVVQNYNLSMTESSAFLVAQNCPLEYFKHLEAWEIIKDRKGTHWKQVHSNDHYLDAECYCIALCEILEGREIMKAIVPIGPKATPRVLQAPTNPIRTKY